MLEGGHAINALPQTARAIVNCRMMPTEQVEDVKATLIRVLGDDFDFGGRRPTRLLSAPPALNEVSSAPSRKPPRSSWPGVPVVLVMPPPSPDGSYLRNAGIPTYGHSGLVGDVDDVRAHGKDERCGEVVPRGWRTSLPAGQAALRWKLGPVQHSPHPSRRTCWFTCFMELVDLR